MIMIMTMMAICTSYSHTIPLHWFYSIHSWNITSYITHEWIEFEFELNWIPRMNEMHTVRYSYSTWYVLRVVSKQAKGIQPEHNMYHTRTRIQPYHTVSSRNSFVRRKRQKLLLLPSLLMDMDMYQVLASLDLIKSMWMWMWMWVYMYQYCRL